MSTKKRKNKLSEEPADDAQKPNDAEQQDVFGAMLSDLSRPEMRSIGVFGEIDEEKSFELIIGMIMLSQKEEKEELDPIDFYISTYGGNSDDMFAIYDTMNHVKKSCEIQTFGLGKVMSAGVLLLASGTKGKRKVGKHCRVMIHSCNAGNIGDLHNLENELKAVQEMQDNYINALVSETSLTRRQLEKLLDRKVNVYLTAKEAIEYGIADEII